MDNSSHRTFSSGFPGRCKRSGSQSRVRIRWTHMRNFFGDSRRINAFGLWCWKRLLKVPWTARSNQSILKEISPEYSLEGLMLTPHYFGHLTQRTDSLRRKDPDAGKDWRWEEKGMTEDDMVGWHHWLNGHEFVQAPGVGDGQGSLACCSPWGHKVSDTTERLNASWHKFSFMVPKGRE